MPASEPTDQADTILAGTPLDHSENMYRFYLELADCSAATRHLIEEFLPQHHAARIVDLDYGFEFDMPIQCAPELVRLPLGRNIAVYQLVRLAISKDDWRKR